VTVLVPYGLDYALHNLIHNLLSLYKIELETAVWCIPDKFLCNKSQQQ
jgi:hypothetical protein